MAPAEDLIIDDIVYPEWVEVLSRRVVNLSGKVLSMTLLQKDPQVRQTCCTTNLKGKEIILTLFGYLEKCNIGKTINLKGKNNRGLSKFSILNESQKYKIKIPKTCSFPNPQNTKSKDQRFAVSQIPKKPRPPSPLSD